MTTAASEWRKNYRPTRWNRNLASSALTLLRAIDARFLSEADRARVARAIATLRVIAREERRG